MKKILFLILILIGLFFAKESLAANVYYSVGQSTSDLKTGSPTMTIASGVATFDTAQTGNIGVGDRISYGVAAATSTIYISAKQSTRYGMW